MAKLNLRKKIILSYLILLLILAIISYQAIKSMRDLGKITDKVIRGNYESIFAAQTLLKILERQQIGQWMLIAGKKDKAGDIFKENQKEFFEWQENAKINARLEGEEALVQKIENFYRTYIDLYQWLEKSMDKKDSSKVEIYNEASRLQLDKLRQHTLKLIELNKSAILKSTKEASDLSTNYISSMIIFSVIGMITGMGVSWWLTQVIVNPVENLTTAVSEIRKGNLDITVQTDYTDEIGILSTEFNKMTQRLREYQALNLEKLIEEKKRTEAVLRSVGDCMIVIDPKFKIILVNPTAERMFYLIPGISIGREFSDIFKSEQLFKIVSDSIENKAVSDRAMLPTFEWNYDRVKKHFQVKVFPVEKEDGDRIAYVILLEDVTKLKKLDQMKSDFISIASHELRTPLTSIIMSLEMLLEGSAGALTNDQRELLEAADEDSRRMRHMMTNLLDISRIESERVEMDLIPVKPSSLIVSVLNSFNAQAQLQKVNMVSEMNEDLPKVMGNSGRILQVFNNLVSNALRYTPEDGTITLKAENKDDFVEFTVADTGSGIPREYLKKIFRKFVQVENDPKRGGAGLGLALSYEIIRAHQGNIWVESEQGEGTKFHFTLPVAKTKQESENQTQEIEYPSDAE